MEAVIELYKCAWNIMDTYTCQPPNYTPLLSDRSVHSPKMFQKFQCLFKLPKDYLNSLKGYYINVAKKALNILQIKE
jgi:hypothetical protein